MLDLERESDRAMVLCLEAQERLSARITSLSDADVRAASRLPGWTVAHVLTHLATKADAYARRIEGALAGHDVPKYAGGAAQREAEIESGAVRPAAELLAGLAVSQARLAEVMQRCSDRGWPNADLLGGGHYGVGACPAHRLREVEMHHVDLGLGYTPADWPDEYVEWDLSVLLASVPDRLTSGADRRAFMAWLAGRADLSADVRLAPW